VRAKEPVKALELGRAEFEQLLSRYPALALEMVRVLSRNLEASNNATIRDLHEKNRQLTQAYQKLKAAQARLIESEKLEHELALAREIQQSILPVALPQVAGYSFGARMLPARAVGGDLYDFVRLADDRIGIAVGDVSDKGVPAAIFMALTTSLLRAEAQRSDTPAEVLWNVNCNILGMNASNMFITMLYGILDVTARTFSYARAGHELPLVFDRDLMPVRVPLHPGLPLGVLDEIALDVQTITLAAGSRLIINTDGVTDALNPAQERFGHERLLAAARSAEARNGQQLCDMIMQAVREFAGPVSQFDDITLACIMAV
jgi:sigma-B regulation protein RsbU (phosphoserine phosphatase)